MVRWVLVMLLVGASFVLIVGHSFEGEWLLQAEAADDGNGGSTVPIPPPDRPDPQATNRNPQETPTSTSMPETATPAEKNTPRSGARPSAVLLFGISLGVASLLGLAIGAFMLVSSRGRNGGT